MQWRALCEEIPASLREVSDLLLKNRNITDVHEFFEPTRPKNLVESQTGISSNTLQAVAKRIDQALRLHEQVVVFGDYDADGVCATGIIWEVLHHQGVKVRPFLPDRFKHGYGLNAKSMEAILSSGPKPDLLITVDNGIVAHDALKYAKSQGISVILTDHHKPEATFPPHDLLVHTTKLCGAGIAWVIADHLDSQLAESSLDLATIATVADQVPIQGANRSIVFHGLQALRQSTRVGLLELFKIAAIDQKTITERTVGFGIAPRINAMGRLGSPLEALRLICTKDQKRATLLASIVNDTNVDRQEITAESVALAESQAKEQSDNPVLVISSDTFHEGVIGLIAGKLVESSGKPVVVLAKNDTYAKGSARSLPGVNIVDLLRSCREHLLEVGGHPMAAGCSVSLENIEALHSCLINSINSKQIVEASQDYEMQLPISLVTPGLEKLLQSFAPFGMKNPQPIFKLHNPTIASQQIFGRDGKHLKYILSSPQKVEIIYWGGGEAVVSGGVVASVAGVSATTVDDSFDSSSGENKSKDIYCKLIGLNKYGVMQLQGV